MFDAVVQLVKDGWGSSGKTAGEAPINPDFVIPAQAGIQEFQPLAGCPLSRE
jgi:hypothetical protein